jgi:hypothetical protein
MRVVRRVEICTLPAWTIPQMKCSREIMGGGYCSKDDLCGE